MIDVHFQDVGVTLSFAVIKVFSQVALGQDLLRVQHEIAQQAKLRGGELDIDPVADNALAAFVQLQASSLQGRLIGQATGTAQQRLHAQHQFFRVKGFAQVIIGTGFQTFDAFSPRAARREDQHRCGQPSRTPLAEHLKPRQPR
ncbi:hypothetical protein D3C77_617750 [compost metagenome]